MPASLAPGTSVSPIASSVAACSAVSVRSGTPSRMRLPRREHDFDAANGEDERADPRALYKGAPFNVGHDVSSLLRLAVVF